MAVNRDGRGRPSPMERTVGATCRTPQPILSLNPIFPLASAFTSWTISLLPCTANLLQSDATLFVAASSHPSLILQLTPVWLPSCSSAEILLSSLGRDLCTTRSAEPAAVLLVLCLTAAFDTAVLLETAPLDPRCCPLLDPSHFRDPSFSFLCWCCLLSLTYLRASHSRLHSPCSIHTGFSVAPQAAQVHFCLGAFAPSILFAPTPPALCIASFGRTGILGSREDFLPKYFPSQDSAYAFISLLICIHLLICRPADHELCAAWGCCLVCSLLYSTEQCSVNTLGREWSGGGDGSQSGFTDHLWKSCSKSDAAVKAEFNTEAAWCKQQHQKGFQPEMYVPTAPTSISL